MSEPPDLDARGLIDKLDAAGVRYVVIGGVAAAILGSPSLTMDLDVCYSRDPDNLTTLASVMNAVHARPRGARADAHIELNARTFSADEPLAFTTDLGDFDVVAIPAGTRGFDDLACDAVPVEIGGRAVLIASIDDLIRMKLATGRLKDLVEVDILGALREELTAHGSHDLAGR